MTIVSSETLHASCIAIGDLAVLIEGRSGAGKSDLALRLIDRGAALVSDDYTVLMRAGRQLVATPPATITGKIEVRGLGILEMPHRDRVPVALLVELEDAIERMPAELQTRRIAGIEVPVVILNGHDASGPIKVELALKRIAEAGS
ncbi:MULTISPECIES: HPr kinase/phosphorylase [unclassified Sphingomonas]|uniref:HPr kinase/phosphorylase n=1 Tax=unclassified Sphingomonas TaxID=196159 RepID=UPI000BC958E0|nr:MAG: aldolase [Sphingomonas sp. 12-62-6]OYX36837.1 MAG: aldolase [Sphingomonas sp. 32-62-10]OYY67179.1 MAG: aldolase [Sphingomonas sp. 28-62-11]